METSKNQKKRVKNRNAKKSKTNENSYWLTTNNKANNKQDYCWEAKGDQQMHACPLDTFNLKTQFRDKAKTNSRGAMFLFTC